nr:MarR family transcriptional regulator [Paenibacillus athensensis]
MDNEWARLEEMDWLFRRMVRKFVKERDKVSIEGIAWPGLLILHKIARDGPQRLGDLAEQLDLTSGAITALCDKLEKKGFAMRRRMNEDRRTVRLVIAEEGHSLLARHRNISQKSIELLFGSFSEQELGAQKRAFVRITEQLEGFADTVLQLAKDNADAKAEQTRRAAQVATGHFLNY